MHSWKVEFHWLFFSCTALHRCTKCLKSDAAQHNFSKLWHSSSTASKWVHSIFNQNPRCQTINPLWRGPGWLLIAWSSVWSRRRPVNGLERRVPTVWTVLLEKNTEGGRLNPFSWDLEGCESADMLCNPHAGLSRVNATRFSLDGCYSDLDTRTSVTRVARSLLNGEYCVLFFMVSVALYFYLTCTIYISQSLYTWTTDFTLSYIVKFLYIKITISKKVPVTQVCLCQLLCLSLWLTRSDTIWKIWEK